MSKLDWEKIKLEKTIRSKGTERLNLLEQPPSVNEIGIEVAPKSMARKLERFLEAIAQSELSGTPLPDTPKSLLPHIEKYIERQDGILGFAYWLPEYNWIKTREGTRNENKRNKYRIKLLHWIAKSECQPSAEVNAEAANIPSELAQEISESGNLQTWARTRPEYSGILKNAQNFAQHKAKTASKKRHKVR